MAENNSNETTEVTEQNVINDDVVVDANGDIADLETSDKTEELTEFEQHIDKILATGELDETLRVIDADGVAQVLPVLDSEPIAHLLAGIEEIGGKANVFVKTAEGIAVLNVAEYTPDDDEVQHNNTDLTTIEQDQPATTPAEEDVDNTANSVPSQEETSEHNSTTEESPSTK